MHGALRQHVAVEVRLDLAGSGNARLGRDGHGKSLRSRIGEVEHGMHSCGGAGTGLT